MNNFCCGGNWHFWTGENACDPHDCPLGRKRNTEQVYVSMTMNAAGLAMVKIVDHITSMDGEAVFIQKSYKDLEILCRICSKE